jgi:6-pyruvoyltetrahydropterin/6-carboxytetrahydropterin synthase
MYEVLVSAEFSAAHALRHYHGGTEPLHGHNFKVDVVVRGKGLQNKVKYLVDFVGLQAALREIIRPMEHTNLNDLPPFTTENPSAENLAYHIAQALLSAWKEPSAKLHSVAVWETASTGARYIVDEGA